MPKPYPPSAYVKHAATSMEGTVHPMIAGGQLVGKQVAQEK